MGKTKKYQKDKNVNIYGDPVKQKPKPKEKRRKVKRINLNEMDND